MRNAQGQKRQRLRRKWPYWSLLFRVIRTSHLHVSQAFATLQQKDANTFLHVLFVCTIYNHILVVKGRIPVVKGHQTRSVATFNSCV